MTGKNTKTQTENWKNFVESLDHKTNSSKLYKSIRNPTNSNTNAFQTHAAITTDVKIHPRRKQANTLIHHYASISKVHTTIADRHTHRLKHKHPLDNTTLQVSNIIRKLKNSAAAGPDNISNHHRKHLGQHGIKTLTNIANYSYSFCIFPTLWKFVKIIALLKPNKFPTDKTSYRPIVLLCTPSNVVERLILKVATQHIPLSSTQHGYRPHHSPITLLTNIEQNMQDNINSRRPVKRTLLLTMDISKAFDAIARYPVINKIYNTELHNIKIWLANYLSGRQAYVHYSSKSSKTLNIPNVVPQGSKLLPPPLFNLYMHDISQPTENIHVASYSDDITITSIHGDVSTYSIQVKEYMDTITAWMNTNRLKITPIKSTATLLTNHNLKHQQTHRHFTKYYNATHIRV
ncbi:Reverse transcriptase domain [Trinorchestia longiramus]|nr:Reverse transcriptase domain [Trinorchestia longiramus]